MSLCSSLIANSKSPVKVHTYVSLPIRKLFFYRLIYSYNLTNCENMSFAYVIAFTYISAVIGDQIVTTKQGQLNGTVLRSRDDKAFYAFYGIPYAAAPVGEFRFSVRIIYSLDTLLRFHIFLTSKCDLTGSAKTAVMGRYSRCESKSSGLPPVRQVYQYQRIVRRTGRLSLLERVHSTGQSFSTVSSIASIPFNISLRTSD